jgi:predicted double-glycine peptidase
LQFRLDRVISLGATFATVLFLTGPAFGAAPVESGTREIGSVRTPDRQIQVPVRTWQGIRNANIVMQQKDYSCGAATLATIVRYFWGDDVTENDFLDAITKRLTKAEMDDRVKNGLSMTDMRRAAVDKGYLAVMGRRTITQLMEATVPVIVRIKHEEHEHFVVLRGFSQGWVYIADPIRGNLRIPVSQFKKEWTDEIVLVVAKRGITPPKTHALTVVPPRIDNPELQSIRRVIAGGR